YAHAFLSQLPPPPSSTLFPYTTLFRSGRAEIERLAGLPIRLLLENHQPLAKRPALRREHGCIDQHTFTLHAKQHFASRHFDRRRSEEHTSELQSRGHLVCRLLLEKKKK